MEPKPGTRKRLILRNKSKKYLDILTPDSTDYGECGECDCQAVAESPPPESEDHSRERKEARSILQSRLAQSLVALVCKTMQEHTPVPVESMSQSSLLGKEEKRRRNALEERKLDSAKLVEDFLASL